MSQPATLSSPALEITSGTRSSDEKSLRILQVVEPGIDGAFHLVEQLTTKLLERGHRVSLAYSDRRGGERLRRLVRDVGDAGGETLNLRVGNGPEPADLPAFLKLWSLARKIRPQVIHAHSSKAGVLGRSLALAGVKARYVYTPHAYYGLSGRTGGKTTLFNSVEKIWGRIGESCMSSIGEADFARDTLGLDAARLHLMLNPIDPQVFAPAKHPAAAKARLGLPSDAIVLGSIGRLSYQKDPATLYRAIAPLFAREPRLHLLHVGRGEMEEELRNLAIQLGITDRVTRVEYLDQPALAYEAMDGLMMTSLYEGLSVVLLEALACDLPLILSRVQGIADIEPGKLSHCWTAEPGDIPAFTQAIQDWLLDLPMARPRNHRAVAVKRFDLEKWLERHLAIYQGKPVPPAGS